MWWDACAVSTKTYEAIVKGQNIPTPGIPESFKVLVKELQSLCLDIRVLDEEGGEIDITGLGEDDTPSYNSIEEVERAADRELERAGKEDSDEESESEDYEDYDDEFESEEDTDEYAFDDSDDSDDYGDE